MLDLEWLKFPRRLFLAPTLNIRHRRSLQKYRKLINISGVCFLRFSNCYIVHLLLYFRQC